MELEPMTNEELAALGKSPEVQDLPEDVRHRVLWAILQATAANALEERLKAAAPEAGTTCAEFGMLEAKAARYAELEAILAPRAQGAETAAEVLRRVVAVAEAVEWCVANGAQVNFAWIGENGSRVATVNLYTPDADMDEESEVDAPTFLEAVAALRKRTEEER